MSHECTWCGSEDVHDGAFLCERCVTTLDISLGNVSAYYDDLDTLRQKRSRYGSTGSSKGSIGKAQPLPVDGRFLDATGQGSQVAWDTRNTVTTWTRVILDEWPPALGPTCANCLHVSCHEIRRRTHPRDTVAACCAYIAGWRNRLTSHEWATELLDEMLDLERRLRRIVDRPADAWYAGACGSVTDTDNGEVICTRELYAEPGSPFVQCRDCSCTYDVAARRKALLAEAEDREATVRTLARIVTTLGASEASEARIENRINVWVTRGRLTSNGRRVIDGRPRPVYRVGDVLDLLASDAEAKGA